MIGTFAVASKQVAEVERCRSRVGGLRILKTKEVVTENRDSTEVYGCVLGYLVEDKKGRDHAMEVADGDIFEVVLAVEAAEAAEDLGCLVEIRKVGYEASNSA
jgi:hypothetical protein